MQKEYYSLQEMEQEAFRALQLKCLDILLYFQKICEENKLTFFLAGGTAIGALRHQGFIPWDEDIDVFMPRPDFEKLTRIWEEKADTSKYIFCRTTDKINFHHHAASIMDVNTTYIEKHNQEDELPQGLVMDVIPLDGSPDSGWKRKKQLLYAFAFALFNAQRLPENKSRSIYRASKVILSIIKSKKIRNRIWMYAQRQMTKYNFYTNRNITELIGAVHGMLKEHPLEDFLDVTYVSFEGYLFPIMRGYDAYLKSVFGNYMELPPEPERVPKGDLVYINLNEPFEKYRGKYYAFRNVCQKNCRKEKEEKRV